MESLRCDTMQLKRTLWICPKCFELKPTRHESVVRHIARKHWSMGEPLSVTTRQTRSQMLASGSLAPIKRHFSTKSTDLKARHDRSNGVDHKNRNINPSPDLIDKAVMLTLVSLVKETRQITENVLTQNSTIISTLAEIMKEISKLKLSRGYDTSGNFAWHEIRMIPKSRLILFLRMRIICIHCSLMI